jgi:6-phospho-beta-glucosidase
MQKDLPVVQWNLMDIDLERLQIVSDFTQSMMKESGKEIKFILTDRIEQAVADCDFVFTTMRVGGAKGRMLDEEISAKHGLIGQETAPPAGLSMGLRNIPVIIDVAGAIEQHAKPDAWLINLANPGGMLTEAVNQETNCKVVGLCNWPYMAWKAAMMAYGMPKDRVFLRFVGVNHMNWGEVFLDGVRVGHDVRKKITNEIAELSNLGKLFKIIMPDDLMDFVGWPYMTFYNRYYYRYDDIMQEEAYHRQVWKDRKKDVSGIMPEDLAEKMGQASSRAEQVFLQDEYIIETYKNMDPSGYDLMKQTRGGGMGYAEAGLDVAKAIWNNTNEIQIVDYPNMGVVDGIPRDYVVENPCLINKAGIWPVAMGEIPTHMTSWIQANKHYELLAIKSALQGDYHAALEALIIHPFVRSIHKAQSALSELLLAHKEFLPNFSAAIQKLECGERLY